MDVKILLEFSSRFVCWSGCCLLRCVPFGSLLSFTLMTQALFCTYVTLQQKVYINKKKRMLIIMPRSTYQALFKCFPWINSDWQIMNCVLPGSCCCHMLSPFLQMEKLRPRVVKQLAEGHTGRKWLIRTQSRRSSNLQFAFLGAMFHCILMKSPLV